MLLNFKIVAPFRKFKLLTGEFARLTDDGEVDLEVSGRRVAKIDSASVNTLVAFPQVSNRQLGGLTSFERGPVPPKVGGAPQLRLAELSIPRVVAATKHRNVQLEPNLRNEYIYIYTSPSTRLIYQFFPKLLQFVIRRRRKRKRGSLLSEFLQALKLNTGRHECTRPRESDNLLSASKIDLCERTYYEHASRETLGRFSL